MEGNHTTNYYWHNGDQDPLKDDVSSSMGFSICCASINEDDGVGDGH